MVLLSHAFVFVVLEVEEEQLAVVSDAVVEHMSAAAELDVPLLVDVGSGPDWDTAH